MPSPVAAAAVLLSCVLPAVARAQQASGANTPKPHGSAELREPVTTVNFIVRSRLGLFGLADAGRTWFDAANDGGWHTGVGGGVWLTSLGQALSVAYASGEGGRLYLTTGMFF